VRRHNEDAFSVALLSGGESRILDHEGSIELGSGHSLLLTVADGLGGQNAGEVASAMAVACLPEELGRLAAASPSAPGDIALQLETALRRTNTSIHREAAGVRARSGMGTTLTCAWLRPDGGILGQVGDSRLYCFRHGRLEQVSRDQSEVGRLLRAGTLTEAEAKRMPGRNIIDQALGVSGEGLAPEVDPLDIRAGDLLLLCSDGLVDRLHDRDLAACLEACVAAGATLPEAASRLIALADQSKSRDNVTVLLVGIGGNESMR
jgi:protein phosphatase